MLRQSDQSAYTDFGVPSNIANGLKLRPGQGFNAQGQLIQIGSFPSEEANQSGNFDPIAVLAERLRGTVATSLKTSPLPRRVDIELRGNKEGSQSALVGIADETLAWTEIDLTYNDVVVVGPPRSGRTTALLTIGAQLLDQGWLVAAVGPADSPLARLAGVDATGFGRVDVVLRALSEFATAAHAATDRPRAVLFDNADQFDSRDLSAPAEALSQAGVRIVGAADSFRAYIDNPFYDELKQARTQLLLCPESAHQVFETVGVMPALRPALSMLPGRGVLIRDRIPTVVQVACQIGDR